MRNKFLKNQKGITLIALIITVIILSILASVAVYSGINSIKSARFTTFTVEMKIMQTEVNELYDKYKNGDSDVLNIGEDITNNDQAKTVLSTIGVASTENSKYKYYSIDTVKALGIEAIEENEFIINIEDRKVVSYNGFEYDGVIYYTLESLPKGLYNVEYEENTNNVNFDLSYEIKGDNEGEIHISNISYDGYVNKWQIRYKEQGKENWRTTETFEGNEYTFKVDKFTTYEIQVVNSDDIVSDTQTITLEIAEKIEDFQTEDTKPYLPSNDFNIVQNTNLDIGLVITDGTNYWTWIEVPKTQVFTSDTTENNYDKIEDDLEVYTGTLLSRDGGTDQWYDGNGKTESETTNPDDTTGCGLTASEYKSLKQTMLSSVYKNGGFWIGQYEVGADTYSAKEDNTRIPVIKKGAYPYNYISCAKAQIKASEINSGDYTSSLMFGIQWDLVLKHLQIRGGMSSDELTNDSTNWGNYYNSTFTIDNGEYTTTPTIGNSFKIYTETTSNRVENSTKIQDGQVLLTTGATDANMKMNIYDLAGNVYEWTLEKSKDLILYPCTYRGGDFNSNGSKIPVSFRYSVSALENPYNSSFRLALY